MTEEIGDGRERLGAQGLVVPIPQELHEVVGILVLTAQSQRVGLHHHEGGGTRDVDLAARALTRWCDVVDRDAHPVSKREGKRRRDDRREIRFQVLEGSGALALRGWRDEEVQGDPLLA